MSARKSRLQMLRELEEKVEEELGKDTLQSGAIRAVAWAIYFLARVYMFKGLGSR